MARITIGGLPWEASEEDVKQLLREHSVDEVQEVVKQYDHERRYIGCMLATLYSADVAQNAIDRLNNISFMNQNIWVKWFGAGWPSMRGSSCGQSKKPIAGHASHNAPLVRQPDAREGVSNSDSWCFRCNRWKNLAGGCGRQCWSLALSREDLYMQQWSIMAMVYQSTHMAQGYSNQASIFQFPPPNLDINQQTANDTQTGSVSLGYMTEPCHEPVLPSSGAPPPPPPTVPGTSPATDPEQGPDLSQTSVSTFVHLVSAPALSRTISEFTTPQKGESKWDTQTVGEQNTPKEDLKGKKNHEMRGKNALDEQVDLDHVIAVDSDLVTALVGLQKEERREERTVARRWRCLETEQNSSDSDNTLSDLATVLARLHKEENKGKRIEVQKRNMRRRDSGGGDQSAKPTVGPTSSILGSSAAFDPTRVRCDYCPLPGLVRREELNLHLKESHSQALFFCSFCSSSFPHYMEAQFHVKSNHSGRSSVVRPVDHLLVTHKCLRCKVRLTSREEAEVQDHVNKAHNGWATIRWECRLCGESFPGKQELEGHWSGRHAATLARTTTEQVQKVPFLQFWKNEMEKKKNKLMTEELMKRKTLKFKMMSSDSSSSSSEEEDQENKLQKFVERKTRKHLELQDKVEFKAQTQNLGNERVEESSVVLKQYKTLSWACDFVIASEKEESRELSRRKVALVDEIHPKDCFQKRKKKNENGDKSSGECSSSETEDSEDGNMKDEFAEEKLLVLQSKLEKALKQRKVLTKASQRRMKEAEECDAFFTDGFLLGDEEATELEDWEDMEMQASNVEECIIERNNNIVEDKSIGMNPVALEERLVTEQQKRREGGKERGKDGKKRKMSKISPLRALFPNRFKMGWKRVHS